MKLFPNGLDIDDRLINVLLSDLLDIEDWITKAILGKAANCQKRLIQEQKSIVINDATITSLPKSEDALADLIIAHTDYKNRAQKEAELQRV